MYPPYTLPFAKMYINNSENLTHGVNQFPHVSSAETETHNHFCPKSTQPFDLPGFSRQKNNSLHMHSHPKLVHALDLPDLISTIAEDLQVSGKGGGVTADIYDAFGLHAEHGV